jgi:NADPH:quinone reductase-like Zn-dependent oxidoreductase
VKSLHLTDDAELVEKDTPQPKPRKGEVLVRVYGAGITPSEVLWYPTFHTKGGEKRAAPVPSHEFSGQIAKLGEGISQLSVGDEVFGMNDWFADGALAEYCITRPESVAPKPSRLDHAEAASVPIGALTAWQGLFDRGRLRAGERVLIHGGAGAVGIFAVQLARSLGAHVITTVSAQNAEFVKGLGANEVIDYKTAPFENTAREIDVVFDTVGGDTLERSWNILKASGRLVTVAADQSGNKAFLLVEANQAQLVEIAKRIDAGALRTVVDTILPFSNASGAYASNVKKTGRGKLVVVLH